MPPNFFSAGAIIHRQTATRHLLSPFPIHHRIRWSITRFTPFGRCRPVATDLKASPSRRVVVAVLSPALGKGVRWTLSRAR